MKIQITDNAKSDITNIFNYSRNLSSNYARKIVKKIYGEIYNLQFSPYIGRYVPELSNKHYRERLCEKYRIIYFISENSNTIYIQYIFCSKQNSELFFKIHKTELSNYLNQYFN